MRAEVPRSFGLEPEGWCCQQIVQINANSDPEDRVSGYVVDLESGVLGDSLWDLGLAEDAAQASVVGVVGKCILQRCRSEGEGMRG
jgi:catabolite regulation protein CreA